MGKLKSAQLKLLKYMKSLNQETLDEMHNSKGLMGFQKLFGKKNCFQHSNLFQVT
jgi:hypothetical protein